MAAIGEIRKRSWLLVVVIVIGMLAFILGDMFNGQGGSIEQSVVAEVNGEKITSVDYQALVDKEFEKTNILFKTLAQKEAPSSEKQRLTDNFMGQYLNQQMFQAQYDKIGLVVSPEEFNDLIQGDNVDGAVYEQIGMFVNKEGKFVNDSLKKYISSYAQNPNFQQLLGEVIGDQAMKMQLQKKYFNMINNGMYTTSYEAKKDFETNNNTATFDFVYAPYSSIKFEEVSVSDADIKAYYNKHKSDKKYDQEDQVSFQYVKFDIAPSKEDLDIARMFLVERVEDFKVAENDTAFVMNNSDTKNFDFKAGKFPKEIDSLVNIAKTGDVIGPYLDGDYYKISKVVKNGFEQEAEVRHILLSNQKYGANPELQQQRADSLVKILKANNRLFPAMVKKFTDDPGSLADGGNGGNYGWFDKNAGFVQPYKDVAFNNPVGTITQTRTQFGIHIMEVLGKRDTDKKELIVATVDSEIRRSKETVNSVRDEALEFINSFDKGAVSDSAFKNAATKLGLTINPATNIKISQATMPEFGSGFDQVKKWSFNKNTDVGEVSDELVSDKFVAIAHLQNRVESGIPSYENLDQNSKNQIQIILINEQKAEQLKAKMNGSTLEEIAKNVNSTVQSSKDASLSNTNIEGIGNEPAVLGAVFGLEANGTSNPIVGETGVFVVKLISKTDATLPENFEQKQREAMDRTRATSTQRTYQALQKTSGLKDNREKVNILGN